MINMISMFSKIKNHALVSSYSKTQTSTATTSTATTSSNTTSGDQTAAAATTTSTSGSKGGKTAAQLNSISSNINSLQSASHPNESSGQQAAYRSGGGVSKVRKRF